MAKGKVTASLIVSAAFVCLTVPCLVPLFSKGKPEESDAERIAVGMSAKEVEAILETPPTEAQVEHACLVFRDMQPGSLVSLWNANAGGLYVLFGADGRVQKGAWKNAGIGGKLALAGLVVLFSVAGASVALDSIWRSRKRPKLVSAESHVKE